MVLTLSSVDAQECYRPLLKDGKEWYESVDLPPIERWDKRKHISGDTLINGERYYRLFEESVVYRLHSEEGEAGEYVVTEYPDRLILHLMEQDGKVYQYQYGTKKLLYDFSLCTGDSLSGWEYHQSRVTCADSILTGDDTMKRLWLTETADNAAAWEGMWGMSWPGEEERYSSEDGCWVEGVGCSRGLTAPWHWTDKDNRRSSLQNCYEDGVCIFTKDDFNASSYHASTDKIQGTENQKRNMPAFDLLGRRLSRQPRNGLYIRGGRKIVVK